MYPVVEAGPRSADNAPPEVRPAGLGLRVVKVASGSRRSRTSTQLMADCRYRQTAASEQVRSSRISCPTVIALLPRPASSCSSDFQEAACRGYRRPVREVIVPCRSLVQAPATRSGPWRPAAPGSRVASAMPELRAQSLTRSGEYSGSCERGCPGRTCLSPLPDARIRAHRQPQCARVHHQSGS